MVVSSKIYESLSEINDNKKKTLYILLKDGEVQAITAKFEMDKILAKMKIEEVVDEEMELFYGYVLDNKELPYEIAKDKIEKAGVKRKLYVFYDSAGGKVEYESCDSMGEVTDQVEAALLLDDTLELEDVVVLFGEEIDLGVVSSKSGETITTLEVYKN